MNMKKSNLGIFFSFPKQIITVLLFVFVQITLAQVGIGTTAPNGALDISSSNSGILIPRLDLDSTTDTMNVVNPAGGALVDGTMVWNTGVGSLARSGYYFWENNRWNLVLSDKGSSVYFGKLLISSTGNVVVTGVGFEPTSVEFTGINRVQGFNEGAYRSDTNNSSDIRMAGGMTTGYAINSSPIDQQVISNCLNGSSINNIGTYSSSSHCIAAIFVNNNGELLHDDGTNSGAEIQEGLVRAALTSFSNDGFTINVDKFVGTATGIRTNDLVVIFKAYR